MARTRRGDAPTEIYQLKVTLRTVHPPVWRRLLVRSDVTLAKLHRILQTAMGWTNTHLYEFAANQGRFGDLDDDAPPALRSASRVRLLKVLTPEEPTLLYEYDFGDGWEHDVVLEKVLPVDAAGRYPSCVAGARACPPEDCGGPYGYAEMLEALADQRHERHDEFADWIGEDFDAKAFDLAGLNELLARVR